MSELYRRKKVIRISNNFYLHHDEYHITFSVPFDDNTEPNEATVEVYNLSDSSINKIKKNLGLSIEAGYGDDHGIIFKGYISDVTSKRDGVDRVTTIKAIDSQALDQKTFPEKSYRKGTKAQTILSDLAKSLGVPIAKLQLKNNYTYQNGWIAGGNTIEEMQKVAVHCGASVYMNKGKLYIRPLSAGDDANFTLSVETGLINSPEYFEEVEEVSIEDMKYNADSKEMETYEEKKAIVTKGYKVQCLLQHRITTGSIITLKSKYANGKFRVRSGTHQADSEFTTDMEIVSV